MDVIVTGLDSGGGAGGRGDGRRRGHRHLTRLQEGILVVEQTLLLVRDALLLLGLGNREGRGAGRRGGGV